MRCVPLFVLTMTLLPAQPRLKALVIDGQNNHDWAAGTRAIRAILEGSGRFTVEVVTHPAPLPDFREYGVVINNFNGGHTEKGLRWPAAAEKALVEYVRQGGGLVIFHAANNAFLAWPEYNDMIGLGWREPSFGGGIAIGREGEIVRVPRGEGRRPGHGPRQDFDVHVLDREHPITRGLPARWRHPAEQLTHGQHGPAEGLKILTYAFSEVSRQGEPMDWVRDYGRGRVYTTMLGHTWKNEANPNLDDRHFQALLARGAEWAATGSVTLAADLGWKALEKDEWESLGPGEWTWMPDGTLLGQRKHAPPWPAGNEQTFKNWMYQQAWLYTRREFDEFDFHIEYYLPPGGNSGVSLRDSSRGRFSMGEPPRKTPAHIGYEVQLEPGKSGNVYTFTDTASVAERPGEWNALEIEARAGRIRTRINGVVQADIPVDPARPKTGPVGLQLHDQFSFILFRHPRLREVHSSR